MTTLSKIKQQAVEEFDEKFGKNFSLLTALWFQISRYDKKIDITVPQGIQDNIKSFLSDKIDSAVREVLGEIKELTANSANSYEVAEKIKEIISN